MEITKKYIKITENNHDKSNFIRISFGYDLGGMNYFTGRIKPRGYYLTVCPVERGNGMEGFVAFSGVSECLHECTRKSSKAEKTALEKIPAYEKMMLEHIKNKYGYVLEV